ncbi:DMT family transporter [Candidatus Pelagibacter sp.]|nr:DMT family transporter [Candidatus Pelagibacter sp.]
MKYSNSNLFPFLLLLIQPIFMASNLVVARGGIEYVPPISLSFWRWLLVFFILLLFNFFYLKRNYLIIKKEYKKLLFLGLMGCGVCSIFPYVAGETTTIVNMGIIYTSSPIFIILISNFLFKEKINTFMLLGLVSCLIGVLIIITKGNLVYLLNLEFTSGDLWMLGAAIGWTLYSVFLFRWKSNLNVFPRFTMISFFGALSMLPFYLIEQNFFQTTEFNSDFYFWVIFAAISPGIIAFSLYTITQKHLGASTTGFTLYLFTVYGAFYGIIFFGETLQNFHYTGAILVFIGIYLAKKKINEIK